MLSASAKFPILSDLQLRRARKPKTPVGDIGRLRQHVATQIDGIVAKDFEAILGQIQSSTRLGHVRLAIAAAEQGLLLAYRLVEQLRFSDQGSSRDDEAAVEIGPALQAELDYVLSRAHIAHSLHCDANISLPGALAHEILKIAREAATNAAKHSAARSVFCSLRAGNDSLTLRIQDDGVGFDPDSSSTGFGLLGLSERARSIGAALNIDTGVGKGTVVTVHCRVQGRGLSAGICSFRREELCRAISQSPS
jgi:signal transduction histidine kinase